MSEKTNGVLSRDAFFKACEDRRFVNVELPDGAGSVKIRKLTLGKLRVFDEAKDNYERAKLLIRHSVYDSNGQPIFNTLEEVDSTLEMPMFKVLSEAVTSVNGLGAVEADAKNSEAATTSASN